MNDDNKSVSLEELILSNTFPISTIMNVLEKKRLVSKYEVHAEVDRLKREMDKQTKKINIK
jgi:hypothetical protein